MRTRTIAICFTPSEHSTGVTEQGANTLLELVLMVRLNYAMKNAVIIGAISAAVIIGGCTKEPSSNSTALPAAGSKPVVISDGTNAWQLGAITINGTNVSTNVTVGIRTREASK